jgi:regulator of RNase E activity RraA
MNDAVAIPLEAAERLKKANTGMVNDALALMGINGGIPGVRPARGCEEAKIVGRAATVLFGAPRPDSPKLNMYQTIRDTPAGGVLVIDGKGMDVHFTGDNQGECAKRQGLAAVEKLETIFEVEGAMERAIASCAPVDEIKTIIARKKPKK